MTHATHVYLTPMDDTLLPVLYLRADVISVMQFKTTNESWWKEQEPNQITIVNVRTHEGSPLQLAVRNEFKALYKTLCHE